MKKFIIAVLAIVAAIVLFFGCTFIMEYAGNSDGGDAVTVTIPQGATGRDMACILKDNGVIRYKLSFLLKIKTSPYRDQLNYGEFNLHKHMGVGKVIEILKNTTFKKEGIKLTVPEGYSIEKIAVLCEETGLVTAEEFLKEVEEGKFDYDFIKDIPDNPDVKYKLQGYLFPSTHIFDEDSTAHDIIDRFLGEFEKQYDTVKGHLPEGMSMNEAIIRASLVEREAKLDSERATISGVIQNRLDVDMILQIDATVVYAITDGMYDVEQVLYSDLRIESPYNTYQNKGLPAGAICNPGLKAIVAAIKPEKHNYIYYHTDEEKKDGSHIFTETFSEHTNS